MDLVLLLCISQYCVVLCCLMHPVVTREVAVQREGVTDGLCLQHVERGSLLCDACCDDNESGSAT